MEVPVEIESGYCPSNGIYYSKWVSPLLPQSTHLSLPSFLLSSLSPQILQKPAFIDSNSGDFITYAHLRSLTFSAARTLRSLGVKKGDVLLVVSPNFLHFPVLILSIMWVGAIFNTANPLNTRQELQTQIKDSNPTHIFTTQELGSKLEGLVSEPIILVDIFMKKVILNCTRDSIDMHVTISQDDIAALMYSSGTTGKSKAVVCTHGSLIAMSCLLKHVWEGEGSTCEEVYMCVVPLFHMFGLSMFVCGALAMRSTAVILRKYSIREVVTAAVEYRVTRLPVVPPMVVEMVRLREKGEGGELGCVKEVICSGAPLGRDYMERFGHVYAQIRLSQCYGLTETNGPITVCDGVSGKIHSSIGRLIPSMEAKIVDVRTQKPVPPLKCGELYVRGPPVMQGYFKNQEATSLAIDKEGWLHTGDLCFIDSCGLVYIVDRIKELIKYKANQVSPAELEEILSTHPEINDAAVIPYPDEERGEIPMACVVRRDSSKVKEEDIIAFIADKVAPYKKIRKVMFVNSIPRSPSGKILRRHLRALNTHQQLEISARL